MKEHRTLFVFPTLNATQGIGPERIPQTKEELADILAKPDPEQIIKIRSHLSYKPLKVMEWLKKTSIYNISLKPETIFEPYFVAHRDMQFYDEIFNSYGFNKLSQVYDMRNLEYKLKMLPDVFAVHIDHTSLNSTDWFKNYGRLSRYNLKVGAFMARRKKLPGLLTNTYKPPLLAHKSNFTYGKLNQCTRECWANDFDIATARRNMKGIQCAFFVGVILFCAAVAYLVMSVL